MKLWQKLGSWVSRHGVQLGLTLRVTVAAVASLAIAQLLQLPLPLWAVLTAVIVSQVSVGRSLKATIDYMIGTLAGVVYGGAVAVLVPHPNEPALLAVLAIAVVTLALIAALKPSMAVAPITAIIVLLVPTITHTSAAASAFDRVLEVGVGGITGFIISFVLLPSRAHQQAAAAAAGTLDAMAYALRALVAGLAEGLDMNALHRIQDGIGHSLSSLTVLAAEAEHERSADLLPILTRGRYFALCSGCGMTSSFSEERPWCLCPRISMRVSDSSGAHWCGSCRVFARERLGVSDAS